MAILTTDPAPQPQPIDIEAWTVEAATAAISSVTIAAPGDSTAATVSLSIPLDDVSTLDAAGERPTSTAAAKEGGYYKRKEPVRRDSLKRREALLKGKEGSRRRLRWENGTLPSSLHFVPATHAFSHNTPLRSIPPPTNPFPLTDRLLNNPHAEPPQPKDWEVHPTHPVHNVPYYLAPLWDAGLARQHDSRTTSAATARTAARTVANKPSAPGIVPKELREKLKRSRGARGLLMDLEDAVRAFVQDYEERARRAERDGFPSPADMDSSEDEEIVFVGRGGKMSDASGEEGPSKNKREMMLFETAEGDQGGSFGRWLVHHIGVYYGLRTWSVTVGEPARREAYVGMGEGRMRAGRERVSKGMASLPRPLWGLV